MGTGPGVRSEGQRVKGHSQLDSTQEEAGVRKEGGKVCFSPSASPLSSPSEEWTPLDGNIELEVKGGAGTEGCIPEPTRSRLTAQSVRRPIDSAQRSQKYEH